MDERTKQLLIRCYNNEMKHDDIYNDEQAIKDLCNETFGQGTPTTAKLEAFNTILFSVADEVIQPKIDQVLNFISTYSRVDSGVTLQEIEVPEECKLYFEYTAPGSQPDFKRIESNSKLYATPKYAQLAIYYEGMGKGDKCVADFRKAVNKIGEAKLRFLVTALMETVTAGVNSGKVPTVQILSGSNTTLKQFKKVANAVSRRCNNGNVTFLADSELIDYYAMQQVTTTDYQVPDAIKESTMKLKPTQILDVNCAALINPYTTKTGNSVEYPVNKGYLMGASVNKPLVITEFGGMEQNGDTKWIDGRVQTMVRFGFNIMMLYGESMGVVTEETVSID